MSALVPDCEPIPPSSEQENGLIAECDSHRSPIDEISI